MHLPAQRRQVVAGGPKELDLLHERFHRGLRDGLGAAFLGKPAAYLRLDEVLELLDPLGDHLTRDSFGQPATVLAPQHLREQRRNQGLGIERAQDAIGEPRLTSWLSALSASKAADC